MSLSLTLRKSANNEVRVRLMDAPIKVKKAGDRAEQRFLINVTNAYKDAGTEVVEAPHVLLAVNPSFRFVRRISEEEKITYLAAQARALDIICDFQQRNTRYAKCDINTVNRPTRFTKSARHTILEAGAVVAEMSSSPSCSTFVTLTLPGDTARGIKELASYSGYLCNRLTQVFRRKGNDCLWFYSWELQSRGALHLHFVVWREEPEESLRLGELLRDKWCDCLKDIGAQSSSALLTARSGDRCWLPETWQNDVEPVYKSVACYISKYVSKSSNSQSYGGRGFGLKRGYPPKRWWGMSRALLRIVRSRRLNVSLEGFTRDVVNKAWLAVNDWMELFNPIKSYAYDFKVDFRGAGGEDSNKAGHANKAHDIVGFERILYFSSSTFAGVERFLPALIRRIASMQTGVVVSGDVAKVGLAWDSACVLRRKRSDVGGVVQSAGLKLE